MSINDFDSLQMNLWNVGQYFVSAVFLQILQRKSIFFNYKIKQKI